MNRDIMGGCELMRCTAGLDIQNNIRIVECIICNLYDRIRDFKNSCFIKKAEEKQKTEQHIKYIDCPICSTSFKEYDFSCPTCGVSVKEIKDQNQIDFIVKKKLYEMSESEKDAYEAAWDKMTKQVKERTGRPFLLENEKIQFWKEYGILN